MCVFQVWAAWLRCLSLREACREGVSFSHIVQLGNEESVIIINQEEEEDPESHQIVYLTNCERERRRSLAKDTKDPLTKRSRGPCK